MSEDSALRWAIAALMLLTMPVGAYHRLKAARSGERISRRGEGWFILITLRLCGLAGALSLLFHLLFPSWMRWAEVPLPLWLRWVGIGLGATSGILLTWVFHNLGLNVTDTVVTRLRHTLVQHGPYRWVRHPMYFTFATWFLAMSLASRSWLLAVASLAVLALLVRRTRIEEANLLARFGDDYRDYTARTGRFLPRLRGLPGLPRARAAMLAAATLWIGGATAGERNVDGIMDNSFLIEEAYNQESGVVQHIFTGFATWDKQGGPDDRTQVLAFTQEWPVFSQEHQFSYTIPYVFTETGGVNENGIGDISLNYRYQAYFDEETLRAVAPRISLILPTGDPDRGLGDDSVGVQFNLPYSQAVGDDWFVHANAGLTFLPDSGAQVKADRWLYNLGGSVIYAATPNLHFLVEWLGVWNEVTVAPGQTDLEFETVISPGARYAFNFDNDSQLVLGLAAPIGLSNEAPDYGVFLYLSFEHQFLRAK